MALQSNPRDLKDQHENLFFRASGFADPDKNGVFHGFFGRRGGVSRNVYYSLNCGPGSDDEPDAVLSNLKIVAKAAGLKPESLLLMHQVHGTDVKFSEECWSVQNRPEIDALVTDRPDLALCVMTADCAPVLLYGVSSQGPVIGAAHAGWRGALGGILENTVEKMEKSGAKRESIKAAIGPCITRKSYEVGEEFYMRFMEDSPAHDAFFTPAMKSGHYQFDLPGFCASKLAACGLKHIHINDIDTYFNEDDFYSYRRATHRGEQDYGRQISMIAIRT